MGNADDPSPWAVKAGSEFEMSGNPFAQFESLGNNCEFGIVQRMSGIDPPGLFRNVGFLHWEQIYNGLAAQFRGMFEPGNFDFELPPGWPDWKLNCRVYGFGFHTAIHSGLEKDGPAWAEAEARCMKVFRFLTNRFLEDAAAGEKIFIFRTWQPREAVDCHKLRDALNTCGQAWLLCVFEDKSVTGFRFDEISEKLIIATMNRLSNENPPVIDYNSWSDLAGAALRLRAQYIT